MSDALISANVCNTILETSLCHGRDDWLTLPPSNQCPTFQHLRVAEVIVILCM